MALTLAEAKKHSSNPQELAIVTELAAGPLLQNLPFREVQGNGLFWKREESLGDVGFRTFNAGYTESYATVKCSCCNTDKYLAAKGVASLRSPMSKAVSNAKAIRLANVIAATSVGASQFATDNAELSDR